MPGEVLRLGSLACVLETAKKKVVLEGEREKFLIYSRMLQARPKTVPSADHQRLPAPERGGVKRDEWGTENFSKFQGLEGEKYFAGWQKGSLSRI
jgi:hypothetical protein